VEISLTQKNISEFNKHVKCLPFSKFFIRELEDCEYIEEFRKNSAGLVESLKIESLHGNISEPEFRFLNSLPAIKHLHVESFYHCGGNQEPRIPLKCLKNLESFQYDDKMRQGDKYATFLYQNCRNINKLKLGGEGRSASELFDWDGLNEFLKTRVAEGNRNHLEIKFGKNLPG